MKKKKRFPLWQFLVLLLCIPTFLISAFFLCSELFQYQAEDHANTELSQKIQQAREYVELPGRSQISQPFPDKFAEYEILWENNHDFADWLFIEDTKIDYPVIHFDTLTEERDYELLAAFYWDPAAEQEGDIFRYYEYTDLSSPEIFEEYIRQVKAHAIYDTGVSAAYGDTILTLSTCSSSNSDGRFVVVAVAH